VTVHVPGVQVIAMLVDDAVPLHDCGPETEIEPSAVTEAENPSKGALSESLQSLSVTVTGFPTRVGSQCCVTFHAPETSGHPPPEEVDDGLELELHAARARRTRALAVRIDFPWYAAGACTSA
jgi:hypothetical protein